MADAHETRVDLLRLRKERVHSTMLVEVLALLIFMSMTFAFVLRDDALKANPWKQKHDRIAAELRKAKQANAGLQRERAELERANRQLLRMVKGTIPANDSLIITQAQWRELIRKLSNAEAVIDRQQRDTSILLARLAGKGGREFPNCTVSPGAFIVSIQLFESGVTVMPAWPSSATPAVERVPGLLELASGRKLSMTEFRTLSSRVKDWGRAQATPCNFRAVAYPKHNAMSVYRRQQDVIGDAFYATYR